MLGVGGMGGWIEMVIFYTFQTKSKISWAFPVSKIAPIWRPQGSVSYELYLTNCIWHQTDAYAKIHIGTPKSDLTCEKVA